VFSAPLLLVGPDDKCYSHLPNIIAGDMDSIRDDVKEYYSSLVSRDF
jgi:thiamine pyrophosphokinase